MPPKDTTPNDFLNLIGGIHEISLKIKARLVTSQDGKNLNDAIGLFHQKYGTYPSMASYWLGQADRVIKQR